MGWFSKNDETPPAPEKRKIPEWAESIQNPLDGWIVTSVFIDKDDRKKRIYFAAKKDGDEWQIYKYSYSPSGPEARLSGSRTSLYKHDAAGAVALITEIEKMLTGEGFAPVAALKGNYHEAANCTGGYIDDKGKYVLPTETKPLGREATFRRSGLKAMYDARDGNAGKKAIRTWDDFYREVVNGRASGEVAISEKDKLNPKLPAVMRLIGEALTLMHAIDGKVMAAGEGELLHKEALSYSGDYLRKLAGAISWGQDESGYDEDGGQPHIVYDYEAARLTSMMRAGAKLYQKLMSSVSVDGDELALLEHINATVGTFAQECLGLAPALAQQLPSVILQGPDPHVDKPLPLEVFYNKYKDQLPPPAPKKTKPKGPSAG